MLQPKKLFPGARIALIGTSGPLPEGRLEPTLEALRALELEPVVFESAIKNAKVLCKALTDAGFRVVSGDTDNHLMLIDLRAFGITGKEMEKRLDEVHITVNKNAIPNDPETPFVTSGIRIGTPAVTSRGFKEEEMLKIAGWIKDIAADFEGNRERVTAEVMALCEKFPIYN